MSCPIFAAILENSDLGVDLSGLWSSLLWFDERSRRDSAGDLEDLADIEETAAWNSAVRSTAMA
jgi:hypothetical protein